METPSSRHIVATGYMARLALTNSKTRMGSSRSPGRRQLDDCGDPDGRGARPHGDGDRCVGQRLGARLGAIFDLGDDNTLESDRAAIAHERAARRAMHMLP